MREADIGCLVPDGLDENDPCSSLSISFSPRQTSDLRESSAYYSETRLAGSWLLVAGLVLYFKT